jgi:N,N-dimethylformamidase
VTGLPPVVRGYTDRPDVVAGTAVTVHVSADRAGRCRATVVRMINGDADPAGPGIRYQEVAELGTFAAEPQPTRVGGSVEVPAHPELVPQESFSVWLHVYASLPDRGRQAFASVWDDATGAGWWLGLQDGRLRFELGDGRGRLARVTLDPRLFPRVWYRVLAVHDVETGTLRLSQRPNVNSVNSVFGRVVPLDSAAQAVAAAAVTPADPGLPLLLGAIWESDRMRTRANLNGKLDSPMLLRGVVDPFAPEPIRALDPIAAWDFAVGISRGGVPSEHVTDTSGRGHHGVTVNQPERGVTGWRWEGREDDFRLVPEQYSALRFHEDSLDDCRWPAALTVQTDPAWRSGCYAVQLRQGDAEDLVPFVLSPAPGTTRAPVLLLMSTLTYVAYGDMRNVVLWPQDAPSGYWLKEVFDGCPVVLDPLDVEVDGNVQPFGPSGLERRIGPYGLALYDEHTDGSGVAYATWRKPILRMRPGNRNTFNYLADLRIVDWLEAKGIAYDVATDHELHARGKELLDGYRVVMTGTHPEYCTGAMLDAWEGYLAGGGRGIYPAANGFYWVTSVHPQRPWLIEVRDKSDGDGGWAAAPGERRQAFTGEPGGTWRRRGRAPQRIVGTGYSAHMLAESGHFVRLPDGLDDRIGWIFDGVAPDERIGDFGLAGGAGGIEADRYDRALGTPPHTLLLASSVGHGPNARVVPEDIAYNHPGLSGQEHPYVRADMVYFTTPAGGAVFSASSISFCASLQHHDYTNNVSRILENVVRRFADPAPVPPTF